MPWAESWGTLAVMRTAGRWPPEMLTRPTPLSWAILFENCRSTMPSTSPRGRVLEVMAMVMTGASAGLTLA